MHVCLVLQSIGASLSNKEAQLQYENGYKELGSILYSNPYIKMSLALNGKTLEFLKKQHSEFLYLLKELSGRGQIEIIGGGYYDPVFPLLLARERTAQIDMLSSAITQEMGRRPHTAMLYASSWDASLLSVFKANGIDCVLLDYSLAGNSCKKDIPIVMSDRGKSIDVFPVSPIDYDFDAVTGNIEDDKEGIRTFCLTQGDLSSSLEDGRFIRLCSGFENAEGIMLSTIADARAVHKRVRSYISCGMAHSVSGYCSIQDFLQAHKSSDDIYHRQTLVAILVEQYHGDKFRKKSARERLLLSQCGDYLFDAQYEADAYQMLNEAESQIHAAAESVTALDVDEDGIDEYVCRMDYHTSVISAGGEVTSFDAMAGKRLFRYSHSLFNDFFTTACKDIIPCKEYTVQKFLRGKKEVFFQRRGSVDKVKVFLRKKYIITSSGFVVQYIIKNESDAPLEAHFAVRFCLLHITEGVRSAMLDTSGSDVSAVQLTDKEGRVSFLIEPNEDAILTKSETLDEGVALSWAINIAGGMECEKTISFAMLPKDARQKEQCEEKPVSKQLSFWDEE